MKKIKILQLLTAIKTSKIPDFPSADVITQIQDVQPKLTSADWNFIFKIAYEYENIVNTDEPVDTNTDGYNIYQEITKWSCPIEYSKGDVIIRSNRPINKFVRIFQGSCKIIVSQQLDGENHVQSNENNNNLLQSNELYNVDSIPNAKPLRTVSMGDIAGEIGAFTEANSWFNLVADEPSTKILAINIQFLQNQLYAHDQATVVRFYHYFSKSLAGKILSAFDKV